MKMFAILFALVLSACGGNEDTRPVFTDAWQIPAGVVAQHVLGTTVYTNESGTPVTVSVTLVADRTLSTPGGTGTLDAYHFIRVDNAGAVTTFPSGTDNPEDITGMQPNSTKSWTQNNTQAFVVPAGASIKAESVMMVATGLDGALLATKGKMTIAP